MKGLTLLRIVALTLALGSSAYAAEGKLTVTATVETSVGLVFGADGEARLVVANAPIKSDNVSTLRPVKERKSSDAPARGTSRIRMSAAQGPASPN
jgi:hypothetical protein